MTHKDPPAFRLLIAVLAMPLAASAGERVTEAASGPPPLAAPRPDDGTLEHWMQGIDGMRRLPVAGVHMVQAGERVFFVSTNGRYVFLGAAIDLWNGERLTSLAAADRWLERLDPARLKLDVGDLGALDVGEGDQEVRIFVDPQCGQCADLLDQIAALTPAERAPYRFRLIPLAVLGQPSVAIVVRLNCLAETDQARATDALLTHHFETLPGASGACGQGALQRALVTAQLLGIDRVPFLIAPDGRLQAGAPMNLRHWLQGDDA